MMIGWLCFKPLLLTCFNVVLCLSFVWSMFVCASKICILICMVLGTTSLDQSFSTQHRLATMCLVIILNINWFTESRMTGGSVKNWREDLKWKWVPPNPSHIMALFNVYSYAYMQCYVFFVSYQMEVQQSSATLATILKRTLQIKYCSKISQNACWQVTYMREAISIKNCLHFVPRLTEAVNLHLHQSLCLLVCSQHNSSTHWCHVYPRTHSTLHTTPQYSSTKLSCCQIILFYNWSIINKACILVEN